MKYISKRSFIFAVITLLFSFSHSSYAASRITNIADVAYHGQLVYKNAGYTLSYSQSHEQKLKKVIEKAVLANSFRAEARQKVHSELLNIYDGADISNLDIFEFDISGPLVVELIGNPDGTVTAKVGGFNMSLHANGDNSYYEIDVTANSNTLWLSGDYDIVTGNITNLNANGFDIDIDIDIDVDIWVYFVPVIGPLAVAAGEVLEEVIPAELENAVDIAITVLETPSNSVALFGLNDSIPTGEFVLGNVDVGQELIDLVSSQFASLVSGESFRLEIKSEKQHYNSVAPAGPTNENPAYTTIPATFNRHTVSINFSDHLFLDVSNVPIFEYRYSNCSWAYCYGASGGARHPVDLANTPDNPSDITIDHPNGDTLVIPYGLDFDIDSLQAVFDANPSGTTGGLVMASGGSFGWGTNENCIWVGFSGGANLNCFGSLVARQQTYSGSYGSTPFTIITLHNSTSYEMEVAGGYPNFKVTTK